MQRGEVWWVEFDPSVGTEIRKTRPGVIVSNNAANRNLSRVVVMPLTSSTDRVYPGEALVTVAGQNSKVMAAEKMRLEAKIDSLSKSDMLAVELAIRVQSGLALQVAMTRNSFRQRMI